MVLSEVFNSMEDLNAGVGFDSNELNVQWEFAAIIQFLKTFGEYLQIDDFYTGDLEQCLLYNPNGTLLVTLQVKLLRLLGQHHVSISDWETALAKEFRKHSDELDHNPFESDADYSKLSLRDKVLVLYYLCEWQLIDIDRFRARIKDEEGSFEWRVDPIGWDAKWNTYWLFDDHRLFREKYQDPAILTGEKKKKPISKGPSNASNTSSMAQPSWELICATSEQWEAFPEQLRGGRNANERALLRVLKDDLLPDILPELQSRERQRRKQEMLDNMPRKRSARLVKKEIEMLEHRKVEEMDLDILLAEEQAIKDRKAVEMEEAERLRKLNERDDRIRQREDRIRQQEEDRIMKEIELQKQREARAQERERRRIFGIAPSASNSSFIDPNSFEVVDIERVNEGDDDSQVDSLTLLKSPSGTMPLNSTPGVRDYNGSYVQQTHQKPNAASAKKSPSVAGKPKKQTASPASAPLSTVPLHRGKNANGIFVYDDNTIVNIKAGEWYFRCACGAQGKNYDDGVEMIECTGCRVWQHVACVLQNQELRLHLQDIDYLCSACQRRSVLNMKKKAAREALKQRKLTEQQQQQQQSPSANPLMASSVNSSFLASPPQHSELSMSHFPSSSPSSIMTDNRVFPTVYHSPSMPVSVTSPMLSASPSSVSLAYFPSPLAPSMSSPQQHSASIHLSLPVHHHLHHYQQQQQPSFPSNQTAVEDATSGLLMLLSNTAASAPHLPMTKSPSPLMTSSTSPIAAADSSSLYHYAASATSDSSVSNTDMDSMDRRAMEDNHSETGDQGKETLESQKTHVMGDQDNRRENEVYDMLSRAAEEVNHNEERSSVTMDGGDWRMSS